MLSPFLFNTLNKSHKKAKKHKPKIEPEPEPEIVIPNIDIPPHLLPQEAAALRGLVHVFDPEITGVISEERLQDMIFYLKEYITKYNTIELRNEIPEQAGAPSDDEETIEEEAIRTGENLCETSDESDLDRPEEYTKEDIDFIAPEDEVEYEEGYQPEKKKSKKSKPKKRKIVEEEEE
jgi:hypothetical protein